MENRKGKGRDLVEKIRTGELKYRTPLWNYIGCAAWAVLCFLPTIAKHSGFGILSFFAQLSTIKFPSIGIYLSIALFIAAIPPAISSMRYRIRRGGCHSEDDTVVLLESGPYRIVRHPTDAAFTIFFITLPIILSQYISFTILSIIGLILIIALNYYTSVDEEKLNIKKWGDEYRQYMKEVPRWNVIRGLQNLKRGVKQRNNSC